MSLIKELNQRNVFRVAITYGLAGWVLLQFADVVLGNIGAPDWVFKTLMLVLVLGFPFVLIFAWAFELTPEGLKKEHEVDRSRSIRSDTGRRLNIIVVCLLVAAVVILLADKLVNGEVADSPAIAEETEESVTNGSTVATINSIAVLPFVNMSSDPEQEYFSDGISEELLNLLAKIPGFRVTGRTSSFEFKGENRDLRKIGKSLGVNNILEGSVRKSNDQVRITAQLVNAADGFHIWSETYDRRLDNIFAVQDEIAGKVVKELKLALLGASFESGSSDPVRLDATAHNAYLQGMFFRNKGGPDNNEQAAQYFEQAVALTPDSPLAWAGLAHASLEFASMGTPAQSLGALSRAREALARAQALDSDVPEVQLALADMKYSFDFDWEGAEAAARRALELRPGDVSARLMLADVIGVYPGRLDEALAYTEDTFVLDPLDQSIRMKIGITLCNLGRFQEAEQAFRLIYDANPLSAFINAWLGYTVMKQGRLDEAQPILEAEPVLFPRLLGRALFYYRLGNLDAAAAAQQELLETYGDGAAYQQAQIYAEWGDKDEAIEWLQRAYEARDPGLPSMANDIGFKDLRDHPGFRELLVKMNLAD